MFRPTHESPKSGNLLEEGVAQNGSPRTAPVGMSHSDQTILSAGFPNFRVYSRMAVWASFPHGLPVGVSLALETVFCHSVSPAAELECVAEKLNQQDSLDLILGEQSCNRTTAVAQILQERSRVRSERNLKEATDRKITAKPSTLTTKDILRRIKVKTGRQRVPQDFRVGIVQP